MIRKELKVGQLKRKRRLRLKGSKTRKLKKRDLELRPSKKLSTKKASLKC
jgi:hypothetical protein